MSTANTQGTPQVTAVVEQLFSGYSIRDLMAAYAMTELLRAEIIKVEKGKPAFDMNGVAVSSYEVADAMLAARQPAPKGDETEAAPC